MTEHLLGFVIHVRTRICQNVVNISLYELILIPSDFEFVPRDIIFAFYELLVY